MIPKWSESCPSVSATFTGLLLRSVFWFKQGAEFQITFTQKKKLMCAVLPAESLSNYNSARAVEILWLFHELSSCQEGDLLQGFAGFTDFYSLDI